MLVNSPSASAHFRLSAQCSRPALPPLSAEDRALSHKLFGCWELQSFASMGKEFTGLQKTKGRLFYSNSFYAAQVALGPKAARPRPEQLAACTRPLSLCAPGASQVTSLKGLFHFAYSGVWHVENGRMYHVILCNSPMACFEGLKKTGKEVLSPLPHAASSHLSLCLQAPPHSRSATRQSCTVQLRIVGAPTAPPAPEARPL